MPVRNSNGLKRYPSILFQFICSESLNFPKTIPLQKSLIVSWIQSASHSICCLTTSSPRDVSVAWREWSIIDISPFEALVKNQLLRCSLRPPCLWILFHMFKWHDNRYVAKNATPPGCVCGAEFPFFAAWISPLRSSFHSLFMSEAIIKLQRHVLKSFLS